MLYVLSERLARLLAICQHLQCGIVLERDMPRNKKKNKGSKAASPQQPTSPEPSWSVVSTP
eukprot:2896988-Amphidinium_carterae.1